MRDMLRAGHGLILIVIALLTIGVVMVTSAGLSVEDRSGGGGLAIQDWLAGDFARPAAFAALAVIMLLIGSCFPAQWLARFRTAASPIGVIVVISIVLLALVHVPGVAREVNGARRWIAMGPIGFQPSEVVKWGLLIVLAWYASRKAGSMGRIGPGFIAPMMLVGLMCALIGTEDLGTAVLIALVSGMVLIAAGARLWHAGLLLPLGAAAFVAAVITSPYRLDRLRAFLDPYQHPQDIGYHVLQSMAAVSGGGLAGRGLGNGLQKFGYLPEDTTDFIFAVICEEMGIIGAAIVIALYVTLLTCGMSIVRRVEHPFQRLLGLGILLTIGIQALINLLVVTGLAPTKGIALPLLSSGGTGWCLTAFSVGLLVSMDRQSTARQRDAAADRADSAECDCLEAASAF